MKWEKRCLCDNSFYIYRPKEYVSGNPVILAHLDGKYQVSANSDVLFDIMHENKTIFDTMKEAKKYAEECVKKYIESHKYSVWVGGCEVNDCLMTESEAKRAKAHWESLGYDDVQIEQVNE